MENSLADKIRIAVNDIMTDVKAELDAKLAALEARVMALEVRPAAPAQDDWSLNFVIYDMAESENENIEEKVNNFKHIRIFHEKPRWQRQHEANVRLLVKSLGTNKLFVRGNRVCARGDQRKHGTTWCCRSC